MCDVFVQTSFDLSFEQVGNMIGELRWIGFESTQRQIETRFLIHASGGDAMLVQYEDSIQIVSKNALEET